MDGKPRPKIWKLILICLLSALGNVLLGTLVSGVLKAPLYLDTIFTVSVTFSFGLLPGLITGVALYPAQNALYNVILNTGADTAAGNAFVLCVVSEILLVHLFCVKAGTRRFFFLEEPSLSSFVSIAAPLLVLAALDCILISIIGGVIDFIQNKLLVIPRVFYPEDIFKLGLIRNNVPLLAAAILSRIPINIVDRVIALFGGYGISLLYRKWVFSHTPRR
jgi:hypothetical protein